MGSHCFSILDLLERGVSKRFVPTKYFNKNQITYKWCMQTDPQARLSDSLSTRCFGEKHHEKYNSLEMESN